MSLWPSNYPLMEWLDFYIQEFQLWEKRCDGHQKTCYPRSQQDPRLGICCSHQPYICSPLWVDLVRALSTPLGTVLGMCTFCHYPNLKMCPMLGSRKHTSELMQEPPETVLAALGWEELRTWWTTGYKSHLAPKWHLAKGNIYSWAFYHLVTKNFKINTKFLLNRNGKRNNFINSLAWL